MKKSPVAILGGTGTVGQKFIELLSNHPLFEVTVVVGSPKRIGQRYGETVAWRGTEALNSGVAQLTCSSIESAAGMPIVFSALDASVALEAEPMLASSGSMVVSNASAFRMAEDVPLIIPEVNPQHLALLERQRKERSWPTSGGIVANPNCATAVLALALAPLHREFGIESVTVATLQAASGAGYPGVPSLDLLDNVIPFIPTEEEKIAEETSLLLGELEGNFVVPAATVISALVHRVPVTDGHLVSASVRFTNTPTPEVAADVLRSFRGADPVPGLYSSPAQPIVIDERQNRPQPRLDRDRSGGMAITVGRIRECPLGGLRFSALGHNLVRGAAGAAIQNAELVMATGSG